MIAFWRDAGPEKWFKKDAEFDRAIAERFASLHAEAAAGRKQDWAETPEGALALILVLDQFSRNMFRGTPKAFAQDEMAMRDRARGARGRFRQPCSRRSSDFFMYLPF